MVPYTCWQALSLRSTLLIPRRNSADEIYDAFPHAFFFFKSSSVYLLIYCGATVQLELTSPHCWDFWITHRHTHSLGLLWMSDQPLAKAVTYTTHNKHKRRKSMHSAGFEPTIPTGLRLTPHGHRQWRAVYYHTLLSLNTSHKQQPHGFRYGARGHKPLVLCRVTNSSA